MTLIDTPPLPSLQRVQAAGQQGSAVITLFMICLALPIIVQISSLRLSPYRLVLLVMFLPCIAGWLTGAAGRIRLADLCVFALAGWCSMSFLYRHGLAGGLEAAGIVAVETITPYLLARIYIRDVQRFLTVVRTLLWIIFAMVPFALIETLTGWNAILESLGRLAPTYADVAKPLRMGLDRVQGPFEHPILFGVFCGPALALCYYTISARSRLFQSGIVFATAALSLSSGPLTALLAQAGMIVWDKLFVRFSGRWVVFAVLCAVGYILVDLVSNRTPAEVFISYAAFNSETAYNRLLIWEWGWVNIWQNPFFGLGKDDWQRLWHMTASFDMFWLQRALVHGMPAGVLNLLVFTLIVLNLMRIRGLSRQLADCRSGLLIGLFGFLVAGMTVHFWNATFVWLMFLLGAGAWLSDHEDMESGEVASPSQEPLRQRMPKGLLDRS